MTACTATFISCWYHSNGFSGYSDRRLRYRRYDLDLCIGNRLHGSTCAFLDGWNRRKEAQEAEESSDLGLRWRIQVTSVVNRGSNHTDVGAMEVNKTTSVLYAEQMPCSWDWTPKSAVLAYSWRSEFGCIMMSRASRGAICKRAWNRLNPLVREADHDH